MSIPHLQNIMPTQQYLHDKLQDLSKPLELVKPDNAEALAQQIFKLLLSKKFRKYTAKPELQEHMLSAIRLNISRNQPINLTFVHGAYKLWRLEEAPEVDWAELFALMHYTNWVKGICEIYEPGVWFDFYVDDLIVPKIDNIDISDIQKYLDSYQHLMDFLKPYQPKNLTMTYTTVGSRFDDEEAFEVSLARNVAALTASTPGGLPTLSEADAAMVELNTRTTDEQRDDPKWREKVLLVHNAYMATKAEPGYHNMPTKIKVFTQPLSSGMTLSVGSTKDSVAKFWVGVGALKPREESFRQIVLSPSQLEKAQYDTEAVAINGLTGKNFHQIRVLKD